MAQLISDTVLLGMIRKLGGVCAAAERGDVEGIFDAQYVDANGIDETGPVFEVRTSDVTRLQLVKGSTLTIGGIVYAVRTPKADGTGMTMLVLQT